MFPCLSRWLLNNLYSDLMLCSASDTFRILTYSALCFFRYMSAYSVIFSVIKTYAYWDIIKANSGICLINLCQRLIRHIQNPAIGHYSAIFRHIYNFRYACICWSLAYLKSLNIQNPSIVVSQHIFRALSYLWKFWNIQNSAIFKTQHIFRTLSKI